MEARQDSPTVSTVYIDSDNETCPPYLHKGHLEYEPDATRTLFVVNLDKKITSNNVIRMFKPYGNVQSVTIKQYKGVQQNAYAFITFATLDMSQNAKVALAGTYIGKFPCKIGFGKRTPTTKIWVGGLGPLASIPAFEQKLAEFGTVERIAYGDHKEHASVLYQDLREAIAAVDGLSGFKLEGGRNRHRVDLQVADFVKSACTLSFELPHSGQLYLFSVQ